MSIFEETGGAQPAVAQDRSLELFCDRYGLIARFASLLNDDPPPRLLLYLYGLGGNGKSLLLRYLAARCCVRLPPGEWARARLLPDAELPAALAAAGKAARVPVARIDFGARPVGENRPQECFSALFMLKQQLAGYQVVTPRFDFAAVRAGPGHDRPAAMAAPPSGAPSALSGQPAAAAAPGPHATRPRCPRQ